MFLKLSFFRKITAFLTLLTLPWDPALPALQAMQIRPESSALLSPLQAVLPPELGTVKERFEGAQAGRCLVIVQDAHAVPDAQRSLQKILEHAARGWGIRFFALEGAASALDTAFFRSYPDENQVRGLIDRHIERGEFSGAAAAALFDETGSYFAGVENSGLYQEGLRLFLAASDHEAALQSRLKVLQDALENEKTEVYTPELLEMDRAVREFRKNTDSLPSLLKMLAAVRRPQAGSRVELLLTEFERSEKKSEQFTGELREAAERMRLFLSENERDRDLRPQMAEFNEKIQGYRNSSLAPESLAAYLGDASVKLGFKIQFSESLEQRIQAHRKMRDLEGTALFDEIEGYIREIMLRLLMNPEQEALEKRSRALELLEKLSRLNVHRSEWRELEQLLRNPKDWPLGGAIPEIQDEGWVRSGFQSAADFYRNTSERDHAILQNIERTMDQRGDAAAVLVAGGFHAESLTFRLKEKGISYVLISPRTDALPEEDLYRRAIRGDVSWKSYFRVKDGKIDLYDAFARAFRDELLEKNPDGRDALLRHWRFNLLRLLAEERRLDQAGAYTRYLDPDREEQTSRKELRPRVEAFVQRLSRMKAGEVTPERILELIRLSRITASASIPFARGAPPLPEKLLRSELRGEGAQERVYEILAQNRDEDFWTWFKGPLQAVDYSIFERIVQGDDQELAKLMREYPGKVYVDRSVKKNNPDFRLPPPQVLEILQAERADQPPVSWWSFLSGYFKRSAADNPETVSPNPALPQRLEEPDPSEGLSVYLTLEKSYRGMTVLRLEGVRPRLDQSKRPAEYQAPKSLSFSVTHENAITISRAAPVPKPFGALTLEQALNAAGWLGRVKKNTRGDLLAGLGGSVDEILGVGSFGRAESAPPRLAFLVTGLAGDDARLRSYTRTEETPRAGEKARYLQQTSFRNRRTNQEKDLKHKEELKLALSLGKLVRSFHDAGFYHGELSLRSFGLKEKGGSKDFEQPVLRSLGALLDKAQIPIQDPHLRNEIAARHRWKDVIRLMLEWGRPEYKTTATRLQTEFLAGYLGEAVDEGAVYAALNLTGVYAAIALLISEKDRDKSAPEKTFTSEQLKNLLQPSLSLMRSLEQQASQRSALRGEEELLQEWNRRYKAQEGKPDDEPGHLGIQFRGASLESAPGSIAEFDFLKAAARIYEPSLRDALSEKPYAVRNEIVQILEFLKNQQLLTEVHAQAMLRSFDAVEKAAGIYHRDGQLTSVTSKDDFLKNYFEAASLVWKSVPILAEALARRQQPTEKANAESLDNSLMAQDENGLHFSLEKGFERITRRQIALVPGVDALEYLREDPARVLRLFRQSIDRGLPLSHELRLALLSYLQEFTERLKEESEKDSQSPFFSDIAQNFRDLMASDKNIMPALWEMYRLGVLEALVPELRQVRDIPSNFNVHIFTVGQHTLYNLQKFEDLRSSEKTGLEEGRRIASALDAPGRLQIRLTLLFHDLGKRMVKLPVEPDHAIVASREIVPRRLRELGVEMTAIQNIAWAVRDHMVLNAFARMDDANLSVKLPVLLKTIVLDPEANLERLKLLYLISLTDRDSVNPWGNLMGPESLIRLNRIYLELEDYLETDPKDRPRSIDDMQRVGHDKTMTQWEAFKSEKSAAIKANLSALDEKGMRGYFKKVPIVPSETFREVREQLLNRAQALSRQNEEAFGRFMDRLLAAFSMERIREFSEEELLERTLFLLHLQMRHEQEDSTPILYFNTGLNRTYERGYEILVGGVDREAFFEGVTGVLLRHGFDIEEADIRTLDGGSVVDTFQGFFRDPYPDEGAHVRMQDSMVNDMGEVFSGTPIGTIFGQAGKPYALEASAPLLSTEAEFLEDAEIYGVPASVFNLKTANRLGLLHALAVILRVKGYNLVSAPVTTHPSRVNDTFFINAGGRHLSLDQKTELAALLKETFNKTSLQFEDLPSLIAPSRSELRTSALERLWPRDMTQEDFETQTLAAWEADWLDEDQVTSFLEASREDENKLVIQFKKQDGSTILKNGLSVYLIIHQDSEGNITSLQSHGYPYIPNDEVFRGVLYWLQSHGIDEIRTDLMSDFLTNLARDWNQSRALDRAKPPAVRIRNSAVIFELNRLNLKGKGGARSELRSAAEGRLGMFFPEREAVRIKYQAGWIAGIFPRLSDAQKKVLLYPNLLMTLLGVKPLYMKVEQGSPSPKSLLLPENPQSLFADSRHEFFLDENQLVALLPAAVTILKHRDWLFQQGVFTEVDRDKLGRMENALSNPEDKDKLFQWTYEVMTKVYRDLISGEPENEVKAHRFYGLLFGYSPRDILASEQAAELPRSDPRFIYGRYEGLAVFSPERYPPWMDRAEASIEYAYGLLKDLPGFNEAAREYTRDFPKEVQLELERLYGGDGRSLSPAESELWNAANRVFDGSAQDKQGSAIPLQRAKDMLWRLRIR
ncbi:MAG: hypothetical protein FGM27_03510, partial [Candidatus Omnitrophica bacterium]|nr:hypothetical protein [Candidatus Omnitrophota bacterium]